MAEGPPACCGGTWWATAAGLLVFGVKNQWGAWAGAVSNPVAFVAFVVKVVPPPLQGKGRHAARAQMLQAWIQACGMVAVESFQKWQ
jgi:hypothetical protein